MPFNNNVHPPSGAMSTVGRLAGSWLCTACFAMAAVAATLPAMAQDWPSKPITLVVPFPPGGSTDIAARLVAQSLSTSLGQNVIVDNRAGASGNIGSTSVARAKPDGYTLVVSGVGTHAANAGLFANMPYDPVKDFTHVTSIAFTPNVIAVNSSFPAKSLPELLDLLRKNPGKYNYASPGNGSSGHLAVEMLKQKAQVEVSHIPYKGAAPAITDVIGNQLPILVVVADAVVPHVKSGRLRVLAVTGDSRNALFPGAPTIAESGYSGFRAVSWTGISGPANLPPAIVQRLQREVSAALQEPAMRERFAANGSTVGGSSTADFNKFLRAEVAQWTQVIKTANITPE